MIAVTAALVSCSGNSGSPPHRVSLPRTVAGYSLQNPQNGSAGTVFYADPHIYGLKGGEYGTVLLDTGYLRQIGPGPALSHIYARFEALAPAGGGNPFGTMRAVPAGPLGGQASCWPVRGSADSQAAGDGAMCAWADNDTFGLLLSPGASTASLAAQMLSFRSAIETSEPAS